MSPTGPGFGAHTTHTPNKYLTRASIIWVLLVPRNRKVKFEDAIRLHRYTLKVKDFLLRFSFFFFFAFCLSMCISLVVWPALQYFSLCFVVFFSSYISCFCENFISICK